MDPPPLSLSPFGSSATNTKGNSSFSSLIPWRAGEDEQVRKILIHAHMAVENAKWTDPHTKANALLQAHFARSKLVGDIKADQDIVLPLAIRLLQASPSFTASTSPCSLVDPVQLSLGILGHGHGGPDGGCAAVQRNGNATARKLCLSHTVKTTEATVVPTSGSYFLLV